MAIFITNRLSTFAKVTASAVNAAIGEIQAALNRMGVLRSKVPSPNSDYFRFDKENLKLYLETIEGETYELTGVAFTEV
jgi:hypothetical protein